MRKGVNDCGCLVGEKQYVVYGRVERYYGTQELKCVK